MLARVLFIITSCLLFFVPTVYAYTPSGQGLFIVSSCSTITSPINGQTWCFLANSNPPALYEYVNNAYVLYNNGTISPSAAGAVGDARVANNGLDATTTPGSPILTSASANFICPNNLYPCSVGGDTGKTIMVPGSGADGVLIGVGVSSGAINRATGAISVTYTFNPSGFARAYFTTVAQPVTSASETGSVVTLTVPSTSLYSNNQIAYVKITGFLGGYNGQQQITVSDSTHLTYTPVSGAVGLPPISGGNITPFFFQDLLCSGPTCSGTVSPTPIALFSTNVREPDGADAFDPGPTTLISTVASIQSPTQLTMADPAGASNPGNSGYIVADGRIIIGTDDGPILQSTLNQAVTNSNMCFKAYQVNSANCNAVWQLTPGKSYLTRTPLTVNYNSSTYGATNLLLEGAGTVIYSAQTGTALTVGPSTLVNSGDMTRLDSIDIEGSMNQGSEGLKLQNQWFTKVDNSGFSNFMIGSEVGTEGNGNTSDNTEFSHSLFYFNGIHFFIHTCDNCSLVNTIAFSYFDRGLLIGDPTIFDHDQTVGLNITSLESGGNFTGSSLEGIDTGGSSWPITITSYYYELDYSTGSALRAGFINGSVNGLNIIGGSFPAPVMGPTTAIDLSTPFNLISNVNIIGNKFDGWQNGIACSGNTSNVTFLTNTFNPQPNGTNWSNCIFTALQNGGLVATYQNGNGNGSIPVTGGFSLLTGIPTIPGTIALDFSASGDPSHTNRFVLDTNTNPENGGIFEGTPQIGLQQMTNENGYHVFPVASPTGGPTPVFGPLPAGCTATEAAVLETQSRTNQSAMLVVPAFSCPTPTPTVTPSPTPSPTPTPTPSATPTAGPVGT